jgi:NTE family protein
MKSKSNPQLVNLALQGGGSHGAFTWGVLDYCLEHALFTPEGVSGTSAGAMNAIAMAHGWLVAKHDGARQALHDYWSAVAQVGQLPLPLQRFIPPINPVLETMQSWWGESLTKVLSPYQFNPLNYHPLRAILDEQIDFERLRSDLSLKVFIATTRVSDGRSKVFSNAQLSTDVLLASACLPTLFQAVLIDGEAYWDGGYTADPALWPFFESCQSEDILLILVNPLRSDSLPQNTTQIIDRLNEVSFNASLISDLRSIAFVQKMHAQGWLKPEYAKRLRNPRLHAVLADDKLGDLDATSKLRANWTFMQTLKDRGRESAKSWHQLHASKIGLRSSFEASALVHS